MPRSRLDRCGSVSRYGHGWWVHTRFDARARRSDIRMQKWEIKRPPYMAHISHESNTGGTVVVGCQRNGVMRSSAHTGNNACARTVAATESGGVSNSACNSRGIQPHQ